MTHDHGAERVDLPQIVADQRRRSRQARREPEATPGPSTRLPTRALPPGTGTPFLTGGPETER